MINCKNECQNKIELDTALDLLVIRENKVEELEARINDLEAELCRSKFNSDKRERYLNLLLDTFSNLCSKPVIDHFNGKCKKEGEWNNFLEISPQDGQRVIVKSFNSLVFDDLKVRNATYIKDKGGFVLDEGIWQVGEMPIGWKELIDNKD